MVLFGAIVPLAATALTAPQADYSEQFEIIADAVTSAQSCEQLDFAVDRQGIVDWSVAVRANAVAAGAGEAQAQAALEHAIREEYGRILERHARARIMQHAPDNVERNNRHWLSRCERLANDSSSAPYFAYNQL